MLKVPRWRLIEMEEVRNKPGVMVIAEFTKLIPDLFTTVPRVYWIVNDTPNESVRGGHYHPPGGKQEMWVCFNGTANVKLHSVEGCGELALDSPSKVLVIPSKVWHEVTLSPGAILVSMASTLYSSHESVTDLPCSCVQPTCGC